MKKLKRYFKKLIEKTFHPYDRKFKQGVRTFLERNFNQISSVEIYSIHAKKKYEEEQETYEVHIKTGRPGILIGQRGRTIDRLTEYLEERFNCLVVIKIKEHSIWTGTFNEDYIDAMLDDQFEEFLEQERFEE
jgi:ribosomal protein S3